MWGMDVIGLITPKASNGHRFILVAIDYFTKWVEASSYANVTQKVVCKFVQKEIICRYGLPERIITDNASNLNGSMMKEVCAKFKIKHHNSTPYRPKMNGAVEAANKNIKRIIEKMTDIYKDWHEKLPFALHAYRTTVRTSTGATPFSLVYGIEAVLPIEVEIPSLRVLKEVQLEEAEWVNARYEQLNLIEEKRLTALCHGQLYQKRMMRAYDKKAHSRQFREGELRGPIAAEDRRRKEERADGKGTRPIVAEDLSSVGESRLDPRREEEFADARRSPTIDAARSVAGRKGRSR
ncbi:RNA-directed DNA polymerase (Reverse transcriptase), Ribonuclease H, putative [Theobroma cacao]|uniref:RNA-directed DNA polymerase (Reverse transcriptase), Ribonuclease H, putative n=1 Tax=Theobroma cacao TaxID=3641 RepID=A0A061ETF1_THECC|nr:RNA-directed DNA polymerase (Reverse transcriptase), Ribonuclease H, putative [Theobroma cacao]